MPQTLEHFIRKLDELARSREQTALTALEWLSTSDPELAKELNEVFQTPEKAASWLSKEVPALGWEMPLRTLCSNREAVLDCLNKIKYGMFA